MTARVFRGQAVYTSQGWFAYVYAGTGSTPYLRRTRFTRWGAAWAAARLARKLNRLEKIGAVE